MAARRKTATKRTTTRKRAAAASSSRKPATTKRAPAKKSAKATAKKIPPAVAPWEELSKSIPGAATPLIVPWGAGSYIKTLGAVQVGKNWYYPSDSVPASLAHFVAPDYSWSRFIARKSSGEAVTTPPPPTTDTGIYTLRADQVADKDKIVKAYKDGAPEFLIASLTGVGKTVVAVAAALEMPRVARVLVICPEPVQAVWRQHLADMGDGGMDWVVINYESNKKLLRPDASTLSAKKAATRNKNLALRGTPWESFDLVITDESHMTGNPTSQQTRVTEKMIDSGAKSMRITATPGKNPSKLHYLRRGLTYATGTPMFEVGNSFEPFVRWCESNGITGIKPAAFGNGITWEGPQSELDAMNHIIFHPDGGRDWALRSEPQGWPEQQRSAFPVQLSAAEMDLYETEWGDFQKAMAGARNSATAAKAKEKGLAAQVRYRQKVGQLKVPHVVDHAMMLLGNGDQVMISAIYKGTVEALTEAFATKGVEVALFTGSNTSTRESERVAFQRGEKKVIIFSTTVGISLHAGEGATNANDAQRSLIVAEPQWSAIGADQTEGRGTRNAQHAHAYYPYAVRTNDEKVVRTMVRGLATMHTMAGSDITLIEQLSAAIGFSLFSDD